MKKHFLILSLFALFATVGFAQTPAISFDKTVHDFGVINEEDGMAKTVFEFTNTGDAPLVISRVNASCGCTTPNWTKEPVAPGEKGTVEVGYNAAGRPGAFTKSVSINSNTGQSVSLIIKGEVKPKPKG